MDVSSTEIEDSISNYRHIEDLSELIGHKIGHETINV